MPALAKAIETTAESLIVVLSDRRVVIAWTKCFPRLASASEAERCRAELSPGGYGVHWPLLDEDLSIGGLVRRAGD